MVGDEAARSVLGGGKRDNDTLERDLKIISMTALH